ncbi:MAG: helix-turn-helix domain-containing protein, partial [Acidimicrobiales bacterium]
MDWQVVASAFGYFKPALIEQMWTSSRERCDLATAVDAHLGALHDFGRLRLAGVEGLEAFSAAAATVTAAAMGDPAGLTLFAGYARLPVPDDPPARAMHHVAVLRELRGSVHLAAVVAAGLTTSVAHAIRRRADVGTF